MPRSLYVSHTGMTEPLGQSQVLPYLRGLARAGWDIHIVAFEPATAERDAIEALVRSLASDGIRYAYTRRSPSHAFATKVLEAGGAFLRLLRLALSERPRIVHARSYLPGAVADLVSSLSPGARFLFDCRGLLGDEYVDAGHWRRESFQYRLLKRVERRMFKSAGGIVVLTERLRRWLRAQEGWIPAATPLEVIPCCVDTARFTDVAAGEREAARARLGAGDRYVLAYAGSLGAWYLEAEMARLFAAIARRRPSLFVVYTHSNADAMRAALAAAGVRPEDVAVERIPPQGMPAALAAADGAVSFIAPCFSKMGSSPTKIAEYLAAGLPVAMNRGVGDGDALIDGCPAIVDAGTLTPGDIERAAERLLAQPASVRAVAQRAAVEQFSVVGVGVERYTRLYARMAASS